jgi:hypothetical protein
LVKTLAWELQGYECNINRQAAPQPAPGIAGNNRRAVAQRTERLRDLLGRLRLPNDGIVVGRNPEVVTAANWSHNTFTAPGGTVFVPDNSLNEVNDPVQPPIRA